MPENCSRCYASDALSLALECVRTDEAPSGYPAVEEGRSHQSTFEPALLLQKGQDIAVEILCTFDDHNVTGVGVKNEPGSFDVLRQVAAILRYHQRVDLTVNDQGGRLDVIQLHGHIVCHTRLQLAEVRLLALGTMGGHCRPPCPSLPGDFQNSQEQLSWHRYAVSVHQPPTASPAAPAVPSFLGRVGHGCCRQR